MLICLGGGDMAGNSIIVKDRVKTVTDSLRALTKQQVLVGIPAAKTDRTEAGPITNAALGYIHETGAPGANIPARPWLIPGVRKSTSATLPHLRGACNAALDGEPEKAQHELVRAGIIAEGFARNEIVTGNFVPLKPATVAARRYSRGTQSRREGEEQYLALIRAGVTPAAAQTAANIHPLINTAQMLKSVTSVVRKAK